MGVVGLAMGLSVGVVGLVVGVAAGVDILDRPEERPPAAKYFYK